MKRAKASASGHDAVLRRMALALPEVEESVTCDKASFKAGGKSFLFVGSGPTAACVMLKLRESLPEARQMAARQPASYKVGGHDWVTITLPNGESLPTALLERWTAESYRLLVPKAPLGDRKERAKPQAKRAPAKVKAGATAKRSRRKRAPR